MHLNATNQAIELATTTSAAIEYEASYVDVPASGDSVWASSQGQIAAVAETTVVAAPGASTARQLHRLRARNAGAAANTVHLQKDVAGTEYRFTPSFALAPGEWFEYSRDGRPRFAVYDAAGRRRVRFGREQPAASYLRHTQVRAHNLSATKALSSTRNILQLQGFAPRDGLTQITWRWRMTTAAATITSAEATVAIMLRHYVIFIGYVDVSGIINSTGLKSATVPITVPVPKGTPLFFGLYVNATTPGAMRAAANQDDVQTYASWLHSTSTQPSTIIGQQFTSGFTVEGTNADRAWVVGSC